MALLALTLIQAKNPNVAVNTDHIVAIQKHPDYTHIVTTATRGDVPQSFNVRESYSEIIDAFSRAVPSKAG